MLIGSKLSYHRPPDAETVTALLTDLGAQAQILAGGTDLVVQMRSGRAAPRHLVDVGAITSLGDATLSPVGLRIPATARITDVVRVLRTSAVYEALAEAAVCVGSMQIQNRATIVGNVCNASPAADTVPALIVHGAQVEILGQRPRREVLDTFIAGPGRTTLGAGEWVSAIHLPAAPGSASAYVKLGRTRGVDLALVGVACIIRPDGARLAFASVGPTAIVVDLPGAVDAGPPDDVGDAIARSIRPIDDVRASGEYRAAMATALAREAWAVASARRSRKAS